MKAIQFNGTIPRYALGLSLSKFFPAILWTGLSCTRIEEVPEPRLPASDWVKIKTHYGGICGTDLNSIHLKTSPYYSAFTSFPFTFGHESIGHIVEVGDDTGDWRIGERVVVEPILWCKPRGFTNLCRYCVQGKINRCERYADGNLAPGMIIGGCRDTGGSWGDYFTAHTSQLYRVPEHISDENALLIEPLACGLHASINSFPNDDDDVLIIGAGTIGLCTLAALRALGSSARIFVLARYPFQAEAAAKLGATEVISTAQDKDYYSEISSHTYARILRPIIGKRVVIGGVDITYECVGNNTALDDAMRLTRSGGKVVLVGAPGSIKNMDWATIFSQELHVMASLTYHHAEEFHGIKWKAFELALHLMAHDKLNLGWLVTHKFRMEDYARGFSLLNQRKFSRIVKAVFEFNHQ